jgi:outer membrane immunogenic protein
MKIRQNDWRAAMKFRILAGVAVTAIMAGSAFAADMPLKAAPPPVLAYDWSGMYIGGVLGGGWGTTDSSIPSLGILGILANVPVVQTTTSSGFIGGVEGGDRYQFGKLVIGWEADITWGNLNGTSNASFGPNPGLLGPFGLTLNRTMTADTNWVGTAVSTVGIAHNNWLIYGKAGVAWDHTTYTDNWGANVSFLGKSFFNGPVFTGTGSDNNNRVGWTVGTGIEWALWNNWSVKAEYDYLDFGTRTVTINSSVVPANNFPISYGVSDTSHINQFKAGLNWHIAPNYW